jgi:hypothetical protein
MSSRRNEAREAYFASLRDETCEALRQNSVAHQLGEVSLALVDALKSSFVAPRQSKSLILPEDQASTDNLVVHPILPIEELSPLFLRFGDFIRPEDRADPELTAQPWFSKAQDIFYPLNARLHTAHLSTWLICKETVNISTRPIIFLHKINLSSPLCRSRLFPLSALAHEADHALKHRDIKSNGLAEYYHAKSSLDQARGKVMLERSAYSASASILSLSGIDTVGMKKEMLKAIKDKTATEAGKILIRLAMSRKAEEEHLRTALSAAVLTEAFGPDSQIPTDDEVTAYRAACLI